MLPSLQEPWQGVGDGLSIEGEFRGGFRRTGRIRNGGLGVGAVLAVSVAGVWRGCQGCVLPRAIRVPAPPCVPKSSPDPAAKSYGCLLACGLPQEGRKCKAERKRGHVDDDQTDEEIIEAAGRIENQDRLEGGTRRHDDAHKP